MKKVKQQTLLFSITPKKLKKLKMILTKLNKNIKKEIALKETQKSSEDLFMQSKILKLMKN